MQNSKMALSTSGTTRTSWIVSAKDIQLIKSAIMVLENMEKDLADLTSTISSLDTQRVLDQDVQTKADITHVKLANLSNSLGGKASIILETLQKILYPT